MLTILILQIGIYLALQIPALQTWLARGVVGTVSNKINGDIKVGKVYFVFFNRLVLNDVSITEKENSTGTLKDTLLSCSKLSVTLSPMELIKGNIKLNSVSLSDGIFNLQNEGVGMSNLKRIFNLGKKQKDTTRKKSVNLLAGSLKLRDFRFVMQNPRNYRDRGPFCMNFADLDVKDIDININSISLERDTLRANIKNISAKEKCGFNLKHLEGLLQVTAHKAVIKDLWIEDEYSNIPAEYFSMSFDTTDDFSDFVNRVKLGINLSDAYINFKTIGKFAPSLMNSSLAFYANGEIEGRVNNIKADNLEVTSESGLTFLRLKARLSGLPDVPSTMASVKIEECHTMPGDIASIIASINNTPEIPFLTRLTPSVRYNFTADLTGLLYDFAVRGRLTSPVGSVNMDILLDASPEQREKGLKLDGFIKTRELNLGKILNNKMLGSVTLDGNIESVFKSERLGGMNVNLKMLKVTELGFNNYNYKNIIATGLYNTKLFDGKIICHDPNLDFIFQGLFSFDRTKNSMYNFYMDMPYANLHALNIDKRDTISEISLLTTANFIRTPDHDINGTIKIKDPYFRNSKGGFDLGDITLESVMETNNYHSYFQSQFMNAQYTGNIAISTFVSDFITSTIRRTAGNYLVKDGKNIETENYITGEDKEREAKRGELNIHFSDTRGLLEALMPKLYVAPKSVLRVYRNNSFNCLDFRSDIISYDKNLLSDIVIDIDKQDTVLTTTVNASKLVAQGMVLDSARVGIKGTDNRLKMNISFAGDSSNTKAIINSNIDFLRDDSGRYINLLLANSSVNINDERWNISTPQICFMDSTITVNDFRLWHGYQTLNVNGRYSKSADDTVKVALNRFNLALLNRLMTKDFDFKGYLSGSAELSYIDRNPNISLNLRGDSIYVAGKEAGTVKVKSSWDNSNKRINITLGNSLGKRSPFMAKGWFKPDSSLIEAKAYMNNFAPGYFAPYLQGIISELDGSVSGELTLKGSLKRPELYGDNVKLNDLGFVVDFTNVPYKVNGDVEITPKGINVKNADLSDGRGGSGKVNGGLAYNCFKDMRLNTNVSFRNVMALNTKEDESSAFYGTAFATGSIGINGPFNRIHLGIDALTNRNTLIHIPLSNASTASQTNILTFKQPVKETRAERLDSLILSKKTKPKTASQMDVELKLNVTPDAEIFIEINKEVGDVLKANGTGLINMEVSPAKNLFNMFGDYNINKGSYKFVVLGLAAKDFTIQPGGMINFNGNIERTNLNLSAMYKTKASINTLIADTSAVSTRRTVECILDMSGRLMNPQLNFSINIPDLDPTVKAQVESALSTDGQIQKQFMALLVSGGFIPNEQSGIANSSTILYSNASEILSNQLNNILQQLGIPIDLGLNYARGDKGTNIFDVAISTSLFNNRVLVSGNMGNDPNTTGRNVIGNFDVEIKLDKNGRLRLNLFSHATDSYSNSLDYSQRNGVGIVYQQGFDSFRQLFRKLTPEEKESRRQIKELEKAMKEQKRKNRKAAND